MVKKYWDKVRTGVFKNNHIQHPQATPTYISLYYVVYCVKFH